MNPHGYQLRKHSAEKSREHVCPFCLRKYTQTTAVIETADESSVVYLPKICPTCTRRALRTSGPLRD